MKNREVKNRTNFLPRNNFWIGLGSVLNLAGNYFNYNHLKSDPDIDTKALISDWNTIGNDIRLSEEKFKKTNSDKFGLI